MARRGEIEIPIAVDTGGFEKGIRNGLIDPIEDAEQALEELGKADPGRDLERDLKKAEDALDDLADHDVGRDLDREMKKAQDATEDLDDELDTTRKSLDKLGYAAKDAGRDSERAFDRAGDGISTFKDEAIQNFSEVASSFSGDLDEMADGVQGLTGGLASALTPGIGIPVAILGAAAAAWFASWQENQEKVEEEIQNWVDAFIEGSGKIDEARVMSGVQEYLSDAEKLAEAQRIVTATGLDEVTVLRALNGDLADSKTVRETLATATDDLRKKAERARDGEAELNAEVLAGNAALGKAEDVWNKHTGALDTAGDRYDIYADAAARGAVRSAEAAVEAGKATKKIDEFGDAVYNLPDGKTLYVDAETGRATEDLETFNEIDLDEKKVPIGVKDNTRREVERIQRRITGTTAYITVGAKTGASVGGIIGRSQRG